MFHFGGWPVHAHARVNWPIIWLKLQSYKFARNLIESSPYPFTASSETDNQRQERPLAVQPWRSKVNKSGGHKTRPYGETVTDVIGAFKSITTHEYTVGVKQSAWQAFSGRLWQRNYYERVVRDDDELHGFREYIRYNPLKWANDENHVL